MGTFCCKQSAKRGRRTNLTKVAMNNFWSVDLLINIFDKFPGLLLLAHALSFLDELSQPLILRKVLFISLRRQRYSLFMSGFYSFHIWNFTLILFHHYLRILLFDERKLLLFKRVRPVLQFHNLIKIWIFDYIKRFNLSV